MATIEKNALFGKLSPQAYQTLEDCAAVCRTRGNKTVEVAHWIDQLIRHGDYDVAHIVRAFKLQPESLIFDVQAAVEGFPKTQVSVPSFSEQIFEVMRESLQWSVLYLNAAQIRSGH